MADRAVKQTATKGSASAVEMAARPFRCEWHEGCSKSFNRKSDLQRHYRIHTNERPYACDYKPCNKTFIQRSALTVHRRTHTGDKPHKCPFLGCGKCFSDSSSLARHRRIHTNDKPYICRNQRCKKAFCRKTTMTKHIRKEHPAEPIQDDQDAEYSDVDPSEDEELEDGNEDMKEESRYQGLVDTIAPLPRSLSSYNKDLWRLPSETTQRPAPLQLRSVPFTDVAGRDIKLERTSSAASQRSISSPYPGSPMSSGPPPMRIDTISNNMSMQPALQQGLMSGTIPQQYQLRNNENGIGLWSPRHSMQESPTSATNSSPRSASAHSRGMFTSQPYQVPPTSLPSNEQMQYPLHHDSIVLPLQQPMDDLAVHEIHLDQPQDEPFRDMASTPVHQQEYDSIPRHLAQEHFTAMSRESSRHQSYIDSQPQSAIQPYDGEVPRTPAPSQPLPYSLPQQLPYQHSQYLPMDGNYNRHYYPTNGAMMPYPNPSMDWLEEIKPEDTWGQLPNQRVPGWI